MTKKTVAVKASGGGGYTFADKVAAALLAQMLKRSFPLEPELGVVTELDFETRDVGNALDDLQLILKRGPYQTRCFVSVKSNRQLTKSGFSAEFVQDAWEQWRGGDGAEVDPAKDILALVVGVIDESTLHEWQELQKQAANTSPDRLAVRLENAGQASATQRAIFAGAPELLVPGILPRLWLSATISVKDVVEYFSGAKEVTIAKEGYTETVFIPKADRSAVEVAIREAVETGKLWLVSGPASILGEQIPTGVLTEAATLSALPTPIPASDVLPAALPDAWTGQETSAVAIAAALSQKYGKPLPWTAVRDAIDGAIRASYVEVTVDSGVWPCPLSAAQSVKLRVPTGVPRPTAPVPAPPSAGVHMAEAELKPNQVQDLADAMPDIVHAAVGHDLTFRVRIELKTTDSKAGDTLAKINKALKDVAPELVMN